MYREIQGKLSEWKGSPTRKPLLLLGARQVGKTYALKEFGKQNFRKVHYLNFEQARSYENIFEGDLEPNVILREIVLRFEESIDVANDLLIFDEIQAIPRALTSLKYFSENMPELALCCAGSLLGVSFNTESFPVGKIDRLWMKPFTFREFLRGIGKKQQYDALSQALIEKHVSLNSHRVLEESFRLYAALGGLPGVINTFRENRDEFLIALQKARATQLNILKDYKEDVAKHSGKIKSLDILQVLNSTAIQLGKSLDEGSHKFVFKDVLSGKSNMQTLSSPISWLVRAGLLYKVHIVNEPSLPLSAFTKINQFKLFLFDTGILGALADLPITTIFNNNYGTGKGAFTENLALTALVHDEQHGIYAWQKNTAEIEFLMSHRDGVVPIEVKSSHRTRARSLESYIKRYRPECSVVASNNPLRFNKDTKVLYLPAYMLGDIHEIL